MIDQTHDLPVVRQVQLLDLLCYLPQPTPEGGQRWLSLLDCVSPSFNNAEI